MNAGGFTAILMALFLRLTDPRPNRIETALGSSELPKIRTFLGDFASRSGWGEEMADRLGSVAEEALLSLARGRDRTEGGAKIARAWRWPRTARKATPCSSSSWPPERRTCRTASPCSKNPPTKLPWGGRCLCACSVISHRRCATGSTTTPTSSRFAWRLRATPAEGSSRERRPRRSARSRINPLSSGPARTRPGSRAS